MHCYAYELMQKKKHLPPKFAQSFAELGVVEVRILIRELPARRLRPHHKRVHRSSSREACFCSSRSLSPAWAPASSRSLSAPETPHLGCTPGTCLLRPSWTRRASRPEPRGGCSRCRSPSRSPGSPRSPRTCSDLGHQTDTSLAPLSFSGRDLVDSCEDCRWTISENWCGWAFLPKIRPNYVPANPLNRGARFQRASVRGCSAGVCKRKALPARSCVVFPRERRTLVCQLSAHWLLNPTRCDDKENDACSCPPLSHSQ